MAPGVDVHRPGAGPAGRGCGREGVELSEDVTDGALLDGVRFRKNVIETETVVMRSVTGTVRWIRAEHRQREKFYLD